MKLETNRIETELAAVSKWVIRPVNLDPGYIEQSKVILFSTKNFYHRAYIWEGYLCRGHNALQEERESVLSVDLPGLSVPSLPEIF